MVLGRSGRTRVRAAAPGDLWSLVEWRASETPSAPLAFDERDRRIDFADFRRWGERVAAGLLECGLRPGQRVAWVLPTRIEALVLTIALARLGCDQVPLIPVYGRREVGFILAQSRPGWAVLPGTWNGIDYPNLFEQVRGDEASPEFLTAAPDLPEGDPATLPAWERGIDDPPSWIFYTSGTTSNPKGVLHSDGTLLASAIGLDEPHAFVPDDRVSLVFPYAHIGGPILLLSALRVGHALILSETFAPEVVIDALSRHGVTLAGPGPAFWQAYLRAQCECPESVLFSGLRALIGGGAAKPARLHAEAREVLGVPIVSGYGLTECPSLAYNHVGDPDGVLASDGRAVAGVEIRIIGDDERVLPADEEGEIRVRGPMLFHGYLDAELDRGALDAEGFMRTGDLGRLDERGSLRVTGRAKDIIIRKGENISAKEVEDVLASHSDIADVAVIGLPDRERGERCCAVVVTRENAVQPTLEEIVAHCERAGLMKQKIPEQLEWVVALPRNSTGKILKTELRSRLDEPS
ncbi:MAG: cyclohexanecarboxylate-CoA ligase [Deltaproteobacteria bacterium]|nr:cyclohexanecarboxylate-CoA ligase [Deltaproteobacteria bacterium]